MIYAVGDVHGMYGKMQRMRAAILEWAEKHGDTNPQIIWLGDLPDRGRQSRQCIEAVIKWKDDWLWGNHEEMIVLACEGDNVHTQRMWMDNGGRETLDSYNDGSGKLLPVLATHIEYMKGLRHYIEFPHHVFVHAGLNPADPYERSRDVLPWIRKWEDEWERLVHVGKKHVVYGHSVKKKPKLLNWSTGLDTGCCYGNPNWAKLSCGVFDVSKPGGPVDVIRVI